MAEKRKTTRHFNLSSDSLAKVAAHLEERMKRGCWACGENDWLIHPFLSGERPYDPQASFIAVQESAPRVRLTCKTCGNIAWFSADIIGVTGEEETTNG